MDLKYRKAITKIKPLHKLCRYLMYNSSYFTFKQVYKGKNVDEIFGHLKNSKSGRCFIIGNGPSLMASDLDRLVTEDCFGTNEIHRIFTQTKWRPKYYIIVDRYSKSTPQEIKKIDCPIVFLSDYYWRFNDILRENAMSALNS